MKIYKIASLFSGIGGFEKGILQANPNVDFVFSSEIDKYARQIYKKNIGVKPHGDITKINAANIPDHDILCGGFPCQAFSIAGNRRGFEDTRGTLFFEIMRIVKVKRPMLLFLENVKGLLNHDGGKTFHTILKSLDELGYDAEWQVFNSKHYGVPQNRERVFIIGHSRRESWNPVFPIGAESNEVQEKTNGKYLCAGTLSTRNQSGQAQWDGSTTLISNAIDANYFKGIDNHGQRTMIISDSGVNRKSQLRNETIAPLRANTGAGHNNIVCELRSDEGIRYYQGDNIRRLTPLECERLQGFPDGWTEGISDTQRYKCLGNAVTVNVVEFIARRIFTMLGEQEQKNYDGK